MGDAKRRSRRLAKLLAGQPWCVYCGGTTAAETVDHVPPITIFMGRQRPGGRLEVPACVACHERTRGPDQIAGMLSRSYPDPASPAERDEMVKALEGVSNNHPGLLEEMLPSRRHFEELNNAADRLPPDAHPLNASGPILNAAMRRFAGRLALALHYDLTRQIVPEAGGVGVRWFSNHEALATDIIPDSLLGLLGPPETLRQGKHEVRDQFLFKSIATEDGGMSAHLATFRLSFGVIAFASMDGDDLDIATDSHVLRPGFLRPSA